MIILNNITKIYQTPSGPLKALDNVCMHVAKGEIFGIIGKSGAGKSTLIHCINLLEKPSSGKIKIAGREMTEMTSAQLRKARHKIGMIFQHFNLLSSKTVYQNVALPLKFLRISKKKIHDKVLPLLEIVGLIDKKDSYPLQLSGGQKQRVAIARSLASDPMVLLSDEATSSLDPNTTTTILDLLKRINKQLKLTIVLITHEISVIKAICDRVAVIDAGHIVEQTDIVKLFTHPTTQRAQQLIHAYFRQKLPALLKQHLITEQQANTVPIIQIIFFGNSSAEPVISIISRDFAVNINILQANIEVIKDQTIGTMLISISIENEKLKRILEHVRNLGLEAEIVGYVPSIVI